MTFALEVKKATLHIMNDATKATIGDIQSRMGAIVDINVSRAYDTGLLANSWEASVGSPFFNEEGNGASSSGAPESERRIKGIESKYKAGDDVFFTNSIEYAASNENGIGMNPRRMLRDGVMFGGRKVIK